MSNKQVILYFLERSWYQALLYGFIVTLDGIIHGEFDLFQPVGILFLFTSYID